MPVTHLLPFLLSPQSTVIACSFTFSWLSPTPPLKVFYRKRLRSCRYSFSLLVLTPLFVCVVARKNEDFNVGDSPPIHCLLLFRG